MQVQLTDSEVTQPDSVVAAFPASGATADGEVDVDTDSNVNLVAEEQSGKLRFRFTWRKLLKFMGPGWLMSLAYLDPGNLESDLQTGAYTGYELVWVLWWATFMGLVLQEISARIGVVTGRDLAQLVKAEYATWLTRTIYVNMEIAVIASDIQEVVGSGIAIYILSSGRIPVWVGCIITGLDTFTFLAVHYFGVRYLEALICALIATMTGCFFVNWAETSTDSGALFHGWVVPTLKTYATTQAVGTIGAVIMPHNLYLHSGLVLSRKIERTSPYRVNEAIKYNAIETSLALLVSFFINLGILAVNANNFYSPTCAEHPQGPYACLSIAAFDASGDTGHGQGAPCMLPTGEAGKCGQIGLNSEANALKYGLGHAAIYTWAIGLLAAGQAATMTCTYAGQVIMGGCLDIQLAPWKRVAFTRAIALGPSIAVAATTISDSGLYNNINEYLNVLQSVQLPFAMLPLLHFSAQKALMGRFRSSPCFMFINICLALVVMSINMYLIYQFLEDKSLSYIVPVCIYGVLYFFVCGCMVWTDIVRLLNC
eukprot:gnl/MRDRNA2_/MRDRNA2_35962_c0_seq1.p1 gnl/MRDRNA2_/MRDRNA2_35962_c0~~gnl/MRDRNA2_/MRDRNA2_35962_c0_seq1.p1  ORF type:complete len:540 (+),score=52.27 gnl/MRDRNA2_/MRDRNA2_35962_c0_seq1:140-1759(+)